VPDPYVVLAPVQIEQNNVKLAGRNFGDVLSCDIEVVDALALVVTADVRERPLSILSKLD
jgi:hypothetical protein